MKPLKFTPLAGEDLDAIWQYISEDNDEAADKFINALLQKCGLLAQNSGLGRTRHDLMVGLRSLPYKNYILTFGGISDAQFNPLT